MAQKIRWIFLSVFIGVLAGFSSALFLWSLAAVTVFRERHPQVIWILPFAGLLIGVAYAVWAPRAGRGTALILDEIHEPEKILPAAMMPLVLGGTLLTHLAGGSAGREGTAVQMGASLADQLTRWIRIEKEERKILLVTGMGAGFSAAIGAPLAGTLFGLEVLQVGRLRLFALMESLIASFVAYGVCRMTGAPHSVFPQIEFAWSLPVLGALPFFGIAFGLLVRAFVGLTHAIEKKSRKWIRLEQIRPAIGGAFLLAIFLSVDLVRYQGLGIPVIQEAFVHPAPWSDFAIKLALTAVTLGFGFKGGEFIPLVFVGATAGSFLAFATGLPVSFFAAIGFSAVFGAASNAPIACAIMAAELLGWSVFLPALIAGWIAYWAAGPFGIYSSQRVVRSKNDQLFYLWRKLASRR